MFFLRLIFWQYDFVTKISLEVDVFKSLLRRFILTDCLLARQSGRIYHPNFTETSKTNLLASLLHGTWVGAEQPKWQQKQEVALHTTKIYEILYQAKTDGSRTSHVKCNIERAGRDMLLLCMWGNIQWVISFSAADAAFRICRMSLRKFGKGWKKRRLFLR